MATKAPKSPKKARKSLGVTATGKRSINVFNLFKKHVREVINDYLDDLADDEAAQVDMRSLQSAAYWALKEEFSDFADIDKEDADYQNWMFTKRTRINTVLEAKVLETLGGHNAPRSEESVDIEQVGQATATLSDFATQVEEPNQTAQAGNNGHVVQTRKAISKRGPREDAQQVGGSPLTITSLPSLILIAILLVIVSAAFKYYLVDGRLTWQSIVNQVHPAVHWIKDALNQQKTKLSKIGADLINRGANFAKFVKSP